MAHVWPQRAVFHVWAEVDHEGFIVLRTDVSAAKFPPRVGDRSGTHRGTMIVLQDGTISLSLDDQDIFPPGQIMSAPVLPMAVILVAAVRRVRAWLTPRRGSVLHTMGVRSKNPRPTSSCVP